jgi:hypothetical protein
MNQAGSTDQVPVLGAPNPAYQARLSFLGLTFGLLASAAERPDRPRLHEVLTRLGEGDPARGRSRLEILSHALFQECGDEREGLEPIAEYERAVAEVPPALPDRLRKIIAAPDVTPASLLTPADVETLERVGIIVSAALLLDGAEVEQPV